MNRRIKRKIAKRTVVFNQTAHKALWTWISELVYIKTATPFILKLKWPGWVINGGDIPDAQSNCLACQYKKDVSRKLRIKDFYCRYCPLLVTYYDPEAPCLNGLYDGWYSAHIRGDVQTARKLALKIANLPVKKGIKTK